MILKQLEELVGFQNNTGWKMSLLQNEFIHYKLNKDLLQGFNALQSNNYFINVLTTSNFKDTFNRWYYV